MIFNFLPPVHFGYYYVFVHIFTAELLDFHMNLSSSELLGELRKNKNDCEVYSITVWMNLNDCLLGFDFMWIGLSQVAQRIID